MKIKLSKTEKQKLINEIQTFFQEERGEEIGIIAAEIVLEFMIENIGKHAYNKALDDAKGWFEQRLEDLSIDYSLLYK